MIRSIQLVGIIAALLFTTAINAQTLHQKMFAEFGTLAEWMNTPKLNEFIENSDELDKKYHGLLDETAITDSKIIALGKVVKGKSVILLYFMAEYTSEGELDFFNLHAATLNQKTGEKMTAEKYLLAAGTRGDLKYNGSYKLKGKSGIVFTQNEVNTTSQKETVEAKEYTFSKELEYLKTY